MAKFSLDDILAEVDSKREQGPDVYESDEDVDDILKSILGDEKGEKKPKSAKGARSEKGAKAEKDEKAGKAEKLTFSGTTREDKRRAAEQKRQAELEEKRKAAEQKRLE